MDCAVIDGQFDVEPGGVGHRRSLRGVGGDVVVTEQKIDADIVCDHQSVESPVLAQHFGQQMVRAMAGFAVDIVIGRHDRTGIGEFDRHLKRQKESVVEFAPAEIDRSVIASAFDWEWPAKCLRVANTSRFSPWNPLT